MVEEQQFRHWVHLYGRELFYTCRRRVQGFGGTEEDAQDLVQDAFKEAWRRREIFEGTDHDARAFLYRFLLFQISNFWRRKHRRRDREPGPPELSAVPVGLDGSIGSAQSPDESVQARLLACRLPACFELLTAEDQRLLQLLYGLCPDPAAPDLRVPVTLQEAAEILAFETGRAFTKSQVNMRHRRALAFLQGCFEPSTSTRKQAHDSRP